MSDETSAAPATPSPAPVAVDRSGAAASPPKGAGFVALLALLIGAVGLVLSVVLARRAGELERRIDDMAAQEGTRDQAAADRDRRIAELERQWNQAQTDADVVAGQMGDPQLRRRREQLALIDIERLVELTQLQLRLGAPLPALIDALGAADARLGRLATPGALRVQVALRHDLARLRAAPDLDRGALATRMDPLIASVDEWHSSADAAHPAQRPAPAPAAGAAAAAEAGQSAGARFRLWISREFGDFVKIREVNTPEALLLTPAQQQLLRDRVRLGLLDLRQAILARDDRTAHAEAAALEALLTRYFDPNQPSVAAALAQMRASVVAVSGAGAPTLDETVAALRAAHAGLEG